MLRALRRGGAASPPAAGSPRDEREHPPSGAAASAGRKARDRLLRLGLVLVAASVLSPALTAHSPTKAYAVATGSMEPTIPTGSVVIAGPGEVEVGTIVVYWTPVGGGVQEIHRVREVRMVGNETHYLTRGDANTATDSFSVPAEDVRGVYYRHVPALGYLWLLGPTWQAFAFTGLLVAYLGLTLWEARMLVRPRLTAFLAVLSTVLLLAPTVLGSVAPSWPASSAGAAVAASPLPLAAGTQGTASVGPGGNTAAVTAAAPKLWKEIALWNCQKDSTCTLNVPSNGYSPQTGSWVRINVADYSPAPTFYLEAYLKAGAGGTTYALLRDKTGSVDIAASEVSTTSTSLTLVRSGAFTLTGDKDYLLSTKKAGANGELHHARLVLVQSFPTKTVEQVRLMQGDESVSTSWSVPNRATKWRFDGASTDGVAAAYFEAVAEVDGNMVTDSYLRLMDRTTATEVARLTVTLLHTAAVRLRSADLKASLVDGHEYELETDRGDGLLTDKLKIYVARLLVLQSGFTKTVRYVDLSWTATTSATSFTTVGYDGRYHMDSEWGGLQAYLEVTAKNSAAGGTSTARLLNRGTGAAVGTSEAAVTGTTLVRARSALVTLDTANATYAVQLKASTGTAELRSAWLIVLQGPGKTYDRVLSTSPVGAGCPWTFTVDHASGTNLTRLARAVVALRGTDGIVRDQVVVASGAVAQTTGVAAGVSAGGRLDQLLTTHPSSAGSSTLAVELRGTCTGYGIRTVQPITFTLA